MKKKIKKVKEKVVKKDKKFKEKATTLRNALREDFKQKRSQPELKRSTTKRIVDDLKSGKLRALDAKHLEKLTMAINLLAEVSYIGKTIHRDTLFLAENAFLSLVNYWELLPFPDKDAIMFRKILKDGKEFFKFYRGDFSDKKILKLSKKV